MKEITQVRFPNGDVIWVRVKEDGTPRDVGLGDKIRSIEGFTSAIQGVARNVKAALGGLQPDELTVEFGLDFAVGSEGLLAALSGVSGSASIMIALKWTGPDSTVSPVVLAN